VLYLACLPVAAAPGIRVARVADIDGFESGLAKAKSAPCKAAACWALTCLSLELSENFAPKLFTVVIEALLKETIFNGVNVGCAEATSGGMNEWQHFVVVILSYYDMLLTAKYKGLVST